MWLMWYLILQMFGVWAGLQDLGWPWNRPPWWSGPIRREFPSSVKVTSIQYFNLINSFQIFSNIIDCWLIVDWFWLLIDFVELIFDWWIVAKGDPSPHISWISSGDGSPLADIPALRQATASNGTLTYWPFAATYYRPDIHSGTIRCSASNSAGTVLSRDVKIRAGQLNSFNWQLD